MAQKGTVKVRIKKIDDNYNMIIISKTIGISTNYILYSFPASTFFQNYILSQYEKSEKTTGISDHAIYRA